MSEDTSVERRAGVVAVFTLASRILGYVRDALLANLFGASAVYDAFVVAQTVPNFLRRLVGEGALVVALVPLLAEEKSRAGVAGMRRFIRAVLGALVPLLVALTAGGMLFPEAIVEVFAPGFDGGRAGLAADMTRIMMPYIFLVSLMAVAGGILNLEGRFAVPAAAPILLNIAIITLAVGFRDRFAEPIYAVAYGVVLGGALQLLLQLPTLFRCGLLVGPSLEFGHPSLRQLLQRMMPALFGVAVYQINLMVIRQIGSFLPDGQLSCYYNATRLQEFALGVFAVSVSVAALPTLSEHAARGDFDALWRTARRALRVTNFVTIPSTLGLLALSEPIVGILFRHGSFTTSAAQMTAHLLMILALALVPIGAVRVLVPVFYAVGDTKTPVWAAAASLGMMFASGHLLKDDFQIYGLTAAVSLSALVQLLVLWTRLRAVLRERGVHAPERDPSILIHGLKSALAAALPVALTFAAAYRFDWYAMAKLSGAAALVGLLGFAVAAYALLSYALGLSEVKLVLGVLTRKLKRKR